MLHKYYQDKQKEVEESIELLIWLWGIMITTVALLSIVVNIGRLVAALR